MNLLSKVIISGPRTSGKTTLLHLLDGDNNLINYNHDKFLQLYDKLFEGKDLVYFNLELELELGHGFELVFEL